MALFMTSPADLRDACRAVLDAVSLMSAEDCPLSDCAGRIAAQSVAASENVPDVERSPYDGYALRSEDTCGASAEHPAVLKIVEEIPAGGVPFRPLERGACARILTGAPLPPGADAVIKFEDTVFTPEMVSVFRALRPEENVVAAGENLKKGDLIVSAGSMIDPGVVGACASQGMTSLSVFRRPCAAVLPVGSEICPEGQMPVPGAIRDVNGPLFRSALQRDGFLSLACAPAPDVPAKIAEAVEAILPRCSALIVTGGVSVGDYDLTAQTLEDMGAQIIVRNIAVKPGGKCCYALLQGKLIAALSGNPLSAFTNFCAVMLPALRKMSGLKDFLPARLSLPLAEPFPKKSPLERLIHGKILFREGRLLFQPARHQGNGAVLALASCTALARIPSGSPPLPAGTLLETLSYAPGTAPFF